jgi:hypothetical protein
LYFVSEESVYIKRTVEKNIEKVAESFPCIVVYGPRQVGKSTTVDHLFGEKYRRVTLDDTDDRVLAESNPKLFLETYGTPLVIDEIQKVPKLLDEIKKIIDEERLRIIKNGGERKLMYILTGSNRFELQQGISESLAGRCGIVEMLSFSQAEKQGAEGAKFTPEIAKLLKRERENSFKYRTKKEIFEDIFTGGMPDVCLGNSERDAYFKSYIATYIEKDVRKLISAGNETTFRNFMSLIALRTACELHYDEISNSVGIDVRTCKKWLSVLETSGIIYLLQPFAAKASNRIIKAPKLYFTDTGLCAYLCKWPNAEMLENCAMSGAFFETYVVSELLKNLLSHGADPKELLFYYRDKDQKEIDIIYLSQNKVYPIEIKKNASPKNAAKNFGVLDKYGLDIQTGLIIDSCDKIRPLNEKVYYYPVFMLGF